MHVQTCILRQNSFTRTHKHTKRHTWRNTHMATNAPSHACISGMYCKDMWMYDVCCRLVSLPRARLAPPRSKNQRWSRCLCLGSVLSLLGECLTCSSDALEETTAQAKLPSPGDWDWGNLTQAAVSGCRPFVLLVTMSSTYKAVP